MPSPQPACYCRFGQHLKNPPPGPDSSLVPLGPGVWHLAKHALWGRVRRDGRPVALDFYEDSLARTPPFEGRWHVQASGVAGRLGSSGCPRSLECVGELR